MRKDERKLLAEDQKIDVPDRSDLPRIQGPWKEPRDNNLAQSDNYAYAGPTSDGSEVPGPNADEDEEESKKPSPKRVAKKWSRG